MDEGATRREIAAKAGDAPICPSCEDPMEPVAARWSCIACGLTDPYDRGAARTVLVPGVNFSGVPELRLAKACDLLAEFVAEVDAWLVQRPVVVDLDVTEDRMRAEVRLRVREEPRTQAWSLAFGYGVDEARQALDALAWELVKLGGRSQRPAGVQFPLATTQKEWKKARATLVPMPPEFVGRVWGTQPIDLPAGQNSDLLVLHDLDRMHKHRGSISASANVLDLRHSFELRARKGGLESRYLPRKPPFELRTGVVVGNIIFSRPVLPSADTTVKGNVGLELLADADGVQIDAVLVARKLGAALRHYFDFIYTGLLPLGSLELGD